MEICTYQIYLYHHQQTWDFNFVLLEFVAPQLQPPYPSFLFYSKYHSINVKPLKYLFIVILEITQHQARLKYLIV